MADKTHKIFFRKTGGAKTLCGMEIAAFYPMSMFAMTDQAGADQIKVTMQTPTCEDCKKKDKET